ncbi:MAG: SDR family NAD(P)-dependent oxidoreductase [Alphaproteobacteria bacterium]|nr:SDR family NAD(P)-dependent oxidoreductase [Alphaproteobacteria bacterium]
MNTSDHSIRTALVTGASYGIGRASALALAQQGWYLVLTDLHPDALAPVVAQAQALGVSVQAMALDLNDADALPAWVADVGRRCPDLGLLVNNAGVPSLSKPATQTSAADWDAVMNINLEGTFLLTIAFGAWLIERGRGGAVVSLSSTHGSVGLAGASVYGISKAGISHMTRMLAIEWATHGIRVNAIAPGTTLTETRAPRLSEPSKRDAMLGRIPLGRFGQADEMGQAVAYLASPQANYITGQILHLDGGLTAY